MKLKRGYATLTGLLLWVGLLGSMAWAQEQPAWRITLQLSDGVLVRTGIGTLPADAVKLDSNHPLVRNIGYMQQNLPGGGSLRRILKLSNGRAVVYELIIKRLEQSQRFEVTLRSVTPTAQEAAQWGIDPARIETDFLRSYSSPLVINDGDILALDVLIEPRTGAKFVDYYLISNASSPIKRQAATQLLAAAREFSPQDAELSIDGYEVWRNGQSVYKNDDAATKGRFIWMDLPQVGRVILTLAAPPPEAGFQRVAVVSDHQIVFTMGADQYEWLSPQRIAPGSGVYHLWMRLDPTFSFPMPKTDRKENDWEIGSAADLGQKPKK